MCSSLFFLKGADPKCKEIKAQDSALHIAVRNNFEEQGVVLLDAQADIFQYNALQENPLFLALTAKPAPLEWFFRPNVISAMDANGDSVVHHAARKTLQVVSPILLRKEQASTQSTMQEKLPYIQVQSIMRPTPFAI